MWSCTCGNTPCDGLECGVFLKGLAPRRALHTKTAAEMVVIRAKAWATRRRPSTPDALKGDE